jgi:hypothetical protein
MGSRTIASASAIVRLRSDRAPTQREDVRDASQRLVDLEGRR